MQQQDSDLLDQYFNGLLAPETAAAVEARAISDTEFGAEFDFRRQMETWLQQEAGRSAVRETLRTVGTDYFQAPLSATPGKQPFLVKWRRTVMAAATALAVLAVATWFLRPEAPLGYRDYAQHAPLSMLERGPDSDDPATAAETAFNQKNYPAALEALNRVLAQKPDHPTAQLYKGITLLELEQAAAARAVLRPLAEGTSALRGEGQWYLALSYLQENNKTECQKALQRIPPGDRRYAAAQALLEKF